MTRIEELKNMNADAIAAWMDKFVRVDDSPYMKWFDETYCKRCEPIMCCYPGSEFEFPCAWCELENKCKFFPDMSKAPGVKEIIKMWLELEIDA